MTTEKAVTLPAAFARFWTASTASTLGDGVYLAALPLVAAGLTTDPVAISLVTGAALLPWPLLGLIGGALVDRWDQRRTMWIADLARAGLLLAVVLAGVFGGLGIPALVALGFLLGVGQLLFDTAAQSYLPRIVGRERELLHRGNAWLRRSQTATEGLVGPPVGALLFGVSRLIPFAADAVSFVSSAIIIRTLPATPVTARAGRGSLWAEAREGATYLLRHRVLLGLSVRPAIGNLAFTAGSAVLVLFAREDLGVSATGYGLLLAAEAIGGLLGTFAAQPLDRLLGTGRALTATAAVEALAVLGLALSHRAVVAGACYAACGAAVAATMVLGPSIRQSIVPERLMGRVSAASRLLAVSAGPLGAVLGGWLATTTGLRTPFYFGAAVLAVMTAVTASLTTNAKIEAALVRADAERGSEAGPRE